MKVVFGCDHAGYRLKEELVEWLRGSGYEVIDKEAFGEDPADYPDFIPPAAKAVANGEADRGVVRGGSGNGKAMAANKVRGFRAALCHDVTTARLSRLH